MRSLKTLSADCPQGDRPRLVPCGASSAAPTGMDTVKALDADLEAGASRSRRSKPASCPPACEPTAFHDVSSCWTVLGPEEADAATCSAAGTRCSCRTQP